MRPRYPGLPVRIALVWWLLAGWLLAAWLLTGCGQGGVIRVFAASSLTDVLPTIVERYRQQHPGVEFDLSFAGSQALATQIEEGAPVSLFISANPVQAERLLAAGLAEQPAVIGENRLVIAVRENASWHGVEELAAADVLIAMGAPSVPVGALTESALDALEPAVAAALRAKVVTLDPGVRIVLSRVELGAVDAGYVYHTDLVAAPSLRAIELPPETPRNQYVAVLVSAGDGRAADLLDFLGDDEAQTLLREAGFLSVTPVAPGASRERTAAWRAGGSRAGAEPRAAP